jgi:hypothetical protein
LVAFGHVPELIDRVRKLERLLEARGTQLEQPVDGGPH